MPVAEVKRLPQVRKAEPRHWTATQLGAAAGAPTAYKRPVGRAPTGGMKISAAYFTLDTTTALDAVNFITVTLQRADGTTIATITNAATAFTARTPRAMTLTAAEVDIPAGTYIELKFSPATDSAADLSAVYATVDIEYQPNV